MSAPQRVLMLGLDAAEAGLIRQLLEAGTLPVLRRLQAEGIFRRMESPANLFAGGVWPTFYSGQPVPWHGLYHNKLWRPENMRVEVPDASWIQSRPLWESTAYRHLQTCLVDVPMLLAEPHPVNGTCLSGWGTHDLISKGSWPANLWGSLERRHGPPVMQQEHFGKQSTRTLAALHASLLRTTDQLCDISIDLLENRAWQFACIVFGATHRAGHYLWNRSQVAASDPAAREPDTASAELAGIYAHTDTTLGRILEHVPDDTLVVVFAVHGMGPNPGWADLFPDILTQALGQLPGRRPRQGMLYAVKRRLPFHWARPLLRALPASCTDRLVQLWSRNMFDWRQTRWFPLPMDAAGYLRINLRGREARGIVEPGAEYDALCDEIEQLVASLRDASSGAAIAGAAVRAWHDAEPQAPCRSLVPDLVIPWHGPAATSSGRLISTQLPGFTYQVPGRLPSGRSGNHTSSAWLIARGPGAQNGVFDDVETIADLLPAVLDQLPPSPAATHS